MLSIISTVFAGPLVGVIGSLFSGVVGYFERKQQIEADKAKYAHEALLLDKQIAARGQELESEAEIASIAADAAALKGSYEHDASYGESGPIISGILRLVRPALTVFLLVMVAGLVFLKVEGIEMKEVALKVLFLSEVAVTWWFADRRRSRK